eukprot:gene22850-25879_t
MNNEIYQAGAGWYIFVLYFFPWSVYVLYLFIIKPALEEAAEAKRLQSGSPTVPAPVLSIPDFTLSENTHKKTTPRLSAAGTTLGPINELYTQQHPPPNGAAPWFILTNSNDENDEKDQILSLHQPFQSGSSFKIMSPVRVTPPSLNIDDVQLDVRDGEDEAEALQERQRREQQLETSDDSEPDEFVFSISDEKEVLEEFCSTP